MKPEHQMIAISRQYQFSPELFPDFEQDNTFFLAMLSDYVGKTGIQLPPQITALDVGCANMQYADGLIAFLQGHAVPEKRKVHLIGVESGDGYDLNWRKLQEWKSDNVKINLHYNDRFWNSSSDLDLLREEDNAGTFDVVSFFAPGPDPQMMLARTLSKDHNFNAWFDGGKYATRLVEALPSRISPQGLLIATLVPGGVTRELFLPALERAGFGIMVDEDNKYSSQFTQLPYKHERIVIAKV